MVKLFRLTMWFNLNVILAKFNSSIYEDSCHIMSLMLWFVLVAHLHHNTTDLIDAFSNWLRCAWYSNSSFSWIGQHFTSNLNCGTSYLLVRNMNIRNCNYFHADVKCHLNMTPWFNVLSIYLSDFFDFGTSFTNQRTTLTSGNNQS